MKVKIMQKMETEWDEALENLVIEVLASEKAYGTLVQSDRYPRLRPYFKKRYFKQRHSGQILTDEFFAITGRQVVESKRPQQTVFSILENKLLEDSMTDREVDVLIIAKEQALILLYQEVLLKPELPNTTNAILQSQAEELNGMLQGLRLDRQITLHSSPTSIKH